MAACAVPPSRSWPRPGPTRIADPSARIAFAGFSILPPDGGDWATAPPLPEDPGPIHRAAVFGKMSTRGQDRTVVAAVLIMDLGGQRFDGPDAFLAFEKSHAEGFLGAQVTARHRLLDSKLALDGSLPARPGGGRIAVGARPVLATFAEGSLWVSNAFSASVSRVDE